MRALAQALSQTSGRNYVVDNKPGAGGLLAGIEVAKGKPDGSLLLHVTGGHASSAVLYSKLPYDAINEFTAVTQLLIRVRRLHAASAVAKAHVGRLEWLAPIRVGDPLERTARFGSVTHKAGRR
jgi:tripartite-type tricarboxylate transporter receptor subunit TctC